MSQCKTIVMLAYCAAIHHPPRICQTSPIAWSKAWASALTASTSSKVVLVSPMHLVHLNGLSLQSRIASRDRFRLLGDLQQDFFAQELYTQQSTHCTCPASLWYLLVWHHYWWKRPRSSRFLTWMRQRGQLEWARVILLLSWDSKATYHRLTSGSWTELTSCLPQSSSSEDLTFLMN